MRVSNSLDPDQDRHRMSVLIWVQAVCKGYQHPNSPLARKMLTNLSSGANSLFKYVHCVDKNSVDLEQWLHQKSTCTSSIHKA